MFYIIGKVICAVVLFLIGFIVVVLICFSIGYAMGRGIAIGQKKEKEKENNH